MSVGGSLITYSALGTLSIPESIGTSLEACRSFVAQADRLMSRVMPNTIQRIGEESRKRTLTVSVKVAAGYPNEP